MNGTTQDAVGVGPEALADMLTGHLLALRGQYLPHAANGHAIAPSDRYAEHVRRDMARGMAKPIKMLLAVLQTDVKDGVPAACVCSVLDLMKADLLAQGKVRGDRPVAVLMSRETKAQSRLDLAQLRLAEHPDDLAAAHAVLDAIREYRASMGDLEAHCAERVVLVARPPRRVPPVRRGPLQMHA